MYSVWPALMQPAGGLPRDEPQVKTYPYPRSSDPVSVHCRCKRLIQRGPYAEDRLIVHRVPVGELCAAAVRATQGAIGPTNQNRSDGLTAESIVEYTLLQVVHHTGGRR